MATFIDDALDGCVTVLSSLTLTGISDDNIANKGIGKVVEGQVFPQIIVCLNPDKPETTKDTAFGGVDRILHILIVIVAANNRDLTTNIPTYHTWREEIMNAFYKHGVLKPYVESSYRNDIIPEVVLNKRWLQSNLAYIATGVDLTCHLPRGT